MRDCACCTNNKDTSFVVKHLDNANNETREVQCTGSHEDPTFAVDAKVSRRSRHHLRELQRAAVEFIGKQRSVEVYYHKCVCAIERRETPGRRERDRRRADAEIEFRGRIRIRLY